MKYQLLVDSDAFWDHLKADILTAKKSVRLQAMTFEGDETGQKVLDAVLKSRAPVRQICVDTFSKFVVSDKFVFSHHFLFDSEFRKEVLHTRKMFTHAAKRGVGVKFTNPMGPLLIKYPLRNHKKIMVIDDQVAYIGGINFGDHNFDWHDMMIRIEDPQIAGVLSSDFQKTYAGHNQSAHYKLSDCDIFFLDGIKSQDHYTHLLNILSTAKSSIQVISPYITRPFLDAIGESAKRGVTVDIISPQKNNKPILKYYLQHQHRKFPFNLKFLKDKMLHLKAIIVDDEKLIVGSTNFDFVSYYLEQELCLVINCPELVQDFKKQIVEPDLAGSWDYKFEGARMKSASSNWAINVATSWCRFLSASL